MNLIKLIEAVRNQSNIYKNLHVDDEEYAREWQKVAKEVGCEISAEAAQDQWNSILIDYMEYLRGNQDFELAKHMDFLQPYLFTMVDHVLDEEELSTILAEDERADATEGEVKDDNEQRNGRAGDNTETVKTVVQENGPGNKQNEKPVLAGTIEKKDITPPPAKATAPPYQESRLSQNESSFSNLSPMELIFMGYAKQLQKMPLALQLKTKRKIADIMDEAELKMMEEF